MKMMCVCVVSDRNSGALNGLSSSENADAKNLRVKVRAFRAVRLVAAGTGGSGSVNILRQLLFVSLTQEPERTRVASCG